MVEDSAQARGNRRQRQLLSTSIGLSCQAQQTCMPEGVQCTMYNEKRESAGSRVI